MGQSVSIFHLDGTRNSDTIHGNGGNDGIGGHRGDDFIFGDAGDDRLHGGQDHDELTGGKGEDTFIFREFAAKDSDKVMDFDHGADLFNLDRHIFTAIEKGGLANSEFVLGTHAVDANDHVIYDKASGKLYYDDDGEGGHNQYLLAVIDNHARVTADDIFIL
jgi:Ca2+-binding RTX toxin-like protein